MIIEDINVTNFGLYKGDNRFNFKTNPVERKNIVTITGKNGVGKSTLQESIHLCIFGSLAISTRLSEADYEQYLYSRISTGTDAGEETKLKLTIQFTKSGIPIKYCIIRKWQNDIQNVKEDVTIIENGQELTDLTKKEKNFFLRELIQPGLSKVIFFDGEKLASLYDADNLTSFVKEGCNYIFGLNFIDLLNKDLSQYINKLYNQKAASHQLNELNEIQQTIEDIDDQLTELNNNTKAAKKLLKEVKKQISEIESEINKQGRWVTKELDALKGKRQHLENTVKELKKELVEIYTHLGPFTFCKKLCLDLKGRLIDEREIEKWQHSEELLNKKAKELEKFLDEKNQSQLFNDIKKVLLKKPDTATGTNKIYHKISDTDRAKLINWINEASDILSKKLKEKTNIITDSEQQLKLLNQKQVTFSQKEHIQPLMNSLQELNKQYGAVEQHLQSFKRKTEEQEGRKAFYGEKAASIQRKISEQRSVGDQLKLSQKAKLVIEEYAQRLLTKKLELLEKKVLVKFHVLCRKSNYFDAVSIDPETFEITLSKSGTETAHKLLSAGEKQLLVLAILWSFREMTNISIPLIMDTPVARLDSEHRTSFIKNFLSEIYPQVILIGTEMEIDDNLKEELKPHVAQSYHLIYDSEKHCTQIFKGNYKKQVA